MRNIIKKGLIALIFSILVLTINPYNTVIADSYWSLDYGWETANLGMNNGTYAFFDFEHDGDDDTEFQVSNRDVVGDQSFYTYMSNWNGWFNFTSEVDDFEYIKQFSFFFEWTDTNNLNPADHYIYLKNDTDTVLQLHFDGDTTTNPDLEYYDVGSSSWVNIINDAMPTDDPLQLVITHQYGNVLNYSVFNATGDYVDSVLGTSNVAGETWTSFNVIHINAIDSHHNEIYFDNFNVTTGSEGYIYDFCTNEHFTVHKIFSNSTVYHNTTVEFLISKYAYAGVWAIYNSEGDVVKNGIMDSQYNIQVRFRPTYNMGTGTFTFRCRYNNQSDWSMSCPFTVLGSTAITDWYIEWVEDDYSMFDWFYLEYLIPSGQTGTIKIQQVQGGVVNTIEGLVGTGEIESIFSGVQAGFEKCFMGYLYNDTNDTLEAYTSEAVCSYDVPFDYDIEVDGVKHIRRNQYDTVTIDGFVQGVDQNVYIRIEYNDTLIHQIPLGSGYFKKNFERDVDFNWNYTTGNETFYVYLGTQHASFTDNYCSVIIVDGGATPTPEPPSPLPDIDTGYQTIGAIMIIGFFSTIPLLMSIGLNKNHQITIPWISYVIFALIGVIVSVLLGWLDIVYLFFLVAMGIIIITGMWLLGKQANSGGAS